MNQFFRSLPIYAQFMMCMLFAVISAGLFSFIGVLMASSFYGVSLDELSSGFDFFAPENLDVAILLNTLNTVGLFLLPALTCASFLTDYPYDYLRLTQKPTARIIILSLVILVLSYPVINFTYALNELIPLPSWMLTEEASREGFIQLMLEKKNLLQNLLVLAILPAFGEELFFRGLIQKQLTKIFKGNIHLAILFVSIVFSALHMQFVGFIPRVFMSVVLGYVYVYSRSIWPGIVVHLLNNAVAIVLGALAINEPSLSQVENFAGEINVLYTLITLGALAAMYYCFKFIKNTNQAVQ